MSELTPRPLNVLPAVQLSPRQQDQLQAIEQYDLWFVIERLVDKGSLAPNRIDQAVFEFRRYVALVALGYDNLGMHSQEVDEVWHAFILFTREYDQFCNLTCGHMIHHTPNTSLRPELPSPSVPSFEQAYTKYFGPLPTIWKANRQAKTECDAEGEEPESEISKGDCDVVQAPPCKGLRVEDCNADGADNCRANLPLDLSKQLDVRLGKI
jgi:hypothetical protein